MTQRYPFLLCVGLPTSRNLALRAKQAVRPMAVPAYGLSQGTAGTLTQEKVLLLYYSIIYI